MRLIHLNLDFAMTAGLLSLRNDSNAATIEELQGSLLDLRDQATNIQARADAEKRKLTDDERSEIDKIFAQFEDTEAEIERRQTVIDMQAKLATPAKPKTVKDDPTGEVEPPSAAQAAAAARARARTPRVEASGNDTGKWGFRNAAEYFSAVMRSSAKGGSIDPRLVANAPTTFGQEGVGADGGFAVPPDFRTAIVTKVMGETSLLSRTDQQTSSSNSISFPADETTPWQTSGGIQANWESEGGQKAQSKPALTEKTVKLNKLVCLVPLTDELLEDAPAMAAYVTRKAGEKMQFKVNAAIISGTGAGMPKGILTSAGTISVTPESGQAADTVRFENIVKMYNRMSPESRLNAVWLLNPDVEAQLQTMQFPGTGTAVPSYLPPGGLSAAPYGTLLGRPILPTQAAPALGDQGDIIFADLSQYLSVVKTGGIRSDVSMHVWFDYDVTAFRFVLRVGGQPWWDQAITSYQAGTATRGFFVTLGARS